MTLPAWIFWVMSLVTPTISETVPFDPSETDRRKRSSAADSMPRVTTPRKVPFELRMDLARTIAGFPIEADAIVE